MRPELKLVKSSQDGERIREADEIRYRYPAEEEVWEVSCGGRNEKSRRTRPALRDSRKAS